MKQNQNKVITNDKLIELKNNDSIEFFVGFVSLITFSKELFKTNNELSEFIKEIFGFEFKKYVVASRTLMFARTIKEIYNKLDKKSIIKAKNNTVFHIDMLINAPQKEMSEDNKLKSTPSKKGKKGKNTTTESISKWIKGLRGE
ncbi:hypothetical protein Xvie_02500 [Xenorhabdus vietnamensis]|uniref:Uncharacterized protein n=2 Tax=Xenorhabdus vietnamensis TaxID=351656 RepID=A0A1Y2SCF7_9GAMM|nr:hypothetical protein Xvie_02500 [Xenorhabdus vietnamensis]